MPLANSISSTAAPIKPDQLEYLKYWIQEREKIRALKEAHVRKPWTKDRILQSFKFCNVHREHDRVTRWFAENWRAEKYWDEPNFIPAIMLGRTINWPDTLEVIGFPHVWQPATIIEKMNAIQASGKKVYTGAYMITAGPTGVKKNDWVIGNANSYFINPPMLDPNSIRTSWESIIHARYPCVGPFIAGQIIADLKQTKFLRDAHDWKSWAALGPGSARGLNRLFGRPLTYSLSQTQGLVEMREVQRLLETDLCLQDVQNCLCEFDKYMRVKLEQGKPRAGYAGA
jgi:hypothetical protein